MAASISSFSQAFSAGNVTSLTYSHTSNGNDLYVIVGIYQTAAEFPTVTFNGVAMAKLTSYREGAGSGASVHFLPSVAAVTANIIITPPGARFITSCALNMLDVGGMRCFNAATNISAAASVTVPCNVGDLILDFVMADGVSFNWTPAAGQTQLYEQVSASSDQKSAVSYKTATANPTTMSQTNTSARWTSMGYVFGPSISGGGGGGGEHSSVF